MSSKIVPTSMISQVRLLSSADMTTTAPSIMEQKKSRPDEGHFQPTSLIPNANLLPVHHHHHHSKMQLQINYEGRVSVVAHSASEPIYNEVSTTLDDSGDDRGSPGSPHNNKTSSDDHKDGSDSDGGRDQQQHRNAAALDSLERLRQICNKTMPSLGHYGSGASGHHGGALDTSMDGEMDSNHLFHCHLCTFTSPSRDEFNDHVNDHYEFRCSKCDYMTKVENDYRVHLKDEHNLTPEDLEDEQGVRTPRINSQGKVKTLKCKQCEYVTVTKEEFWSHCKGHIKPEKLLTCPKCSFVTEYKHHLEYHLRNHFGSKPFKCPQCSYSCVNKSMLNSHMKSHTTIYQYRCADCNYATKYCHSLKLHLRKYEHKPAMVLNPDGTPNPLPIVDVYGTRRGPKIKRDEHGNVIGPPQALSFQSDKGSCNSSSLPSSPGNGGFPLVPPYMMAQMKMHQLQQSFPPFGPGGDHRFQLLHQNMDDPDDDMDDEIDEDDDHIEEDDPPRSYKDEKHQLKCAICDFETLDRDIFRNHMVLHATRDRDERQPLPSPKQALGPISPEKPPTPSLPRYTMGLGFPPLPDAPDLIKKERSTMESEINKALAIPKARIQAEEFVPESSSSPSDYFEYLKHMAPLLKRSAELGSSTSGGMMSSSLSSGLSSPPPSGLGPHSFMPGGANGGGLLSRLYLGSVVKNFQQREASIGDADSNASSGGALDLSQGFELKSNGIEVENAHSDQSGRSSSGNGSNKSRRKGRAYKIERKLDSLNGGGDSSSVHSGVSSEPEDAKSEESVCKNVSSVTGTNGSYSEPDLDKHPKSEPNLSGSHVCEPCQIAFMDSCMFTFHRDCHDRMNPLKCIKCGLVLDDAKDFFLHLIKESHK